MHSSKPNIPYYRKLTETALKTATLATSAPHPVNSQSIWGFKNMVLRGKSCGDDGTLQLHNKSKYVLNFS